MSETDSIHDTGIHKTRALVRHLDTVIFNFEIYENIYSPLLRPALLNNVQFLTSDVPNSRGYSELANKLILDSNIEFSDFHQHFVTSDLENTQ